MISGSQSTAKEVDDVISTLTKHTPATGLSSYVALAQSCMAPNAAAQGTGLSAAVQAVTPFATAGVRSIDLPGSCPRGAPV